MRHLLSINDLGLDTSIFNIANTLKYQGTLIGKTITTLFYEPSTRTRLSFELAAKRQGAEVIAFDPEISSEQKGESLKDTALTLQALGADVLVIRHPKNGVPKEISQWVDCSVVNAGDGTNEHPTQALIDLYTIKQKLGSVAGVRVGIVGDVKHSRVAHSLYLALAKAGADPVLIGPKDVVSSRPGPYVKYDLDAELPSLDVYYVLRAQTERHGKDYYLSHFNDYKLTVERASRLPSHAIVMHPGPMNRGVEIDSDVADSSRSVILDQVKNGVIVRAAVLYWLLRGRG